MPSYRPGIRDKLIGIFILIKVIPLIALAWFAWTEISNLSHTIEDQVNEMARTSLETTTQVSALATSSSIRALDLKAREAIERLTTDTARAVASFLYDRDDDITLAAMLPVDETAYTRFMEIHEREITIHEPWVLNEAGDAWQPGHDPAVDRGHETKYARNPDNELDFHYRPPDSGMIKEKIPLFLEITFVELSGQETLKITTSDLLPDDLRDVSKKENTYCRAETYFDELKALAPGEIYVSEVIGAYVRTHMIGPYTRVTAQEKNVAFQPEQSGYAGKENPVGKRFQGLIRWATPVVRDGGIIGYVTLALDHTHIMEFTDHIMPTAERYTDISDAASGNYAFMWDFKGRNISHPRDYFIVGYDPETGQPAIPWLDAKTYAEYIQSGMDVQAFLPTLPERKDQALSIKPSTELVKQGYVALDCRYLNFAPQCDGWENVTEDGGSGSFVIFWSGLLKLTTAGAIPYYTGQYGRDPQGFGFVTIGANVHEFHKAADTTAEKIKSVEKRYSASINTQKQKNQETMMTSLQDTARRMTYYTGIMVLVVIIIAIFMAAALTGRITRVIDGVARFRKGEMDYRLEIDTRDEMGELSKAINSMADSMQKSFNALQLSKQKIEVSNESLKNQIKGRIKVQKQLQRNRDKLEGIVKERTVELEREIVERKEKETALQGLKNMLSRIIDSMPSIIVVVDTRARIILWNQEAQFLTGINEENANDRSLFDVLPFMEKEQSIVFKAIQEGVIQKEQKLEMVRDEERIFFELTVYPLMAAQIDIDLPIEGAVIRIDNITQRVYMEEMMIQTEKMQSIGSLAAGMAHEINNPLAGIMQNAQVMRNRIQENLPKNLEVAQETGVSLEKVQAYMSKREVFNMIDAIMASGRRAADIVANMLSFSRKSESSYSNHNICDLMDRTIEIIENDYDFKKRVDFKNIEIRRDYRFCDSTVECDSGKIQQVFFNILKNGAQAMMESQEERKPTFSISVFRQARHVVIEVEDNGPGMNEHMKTHVFEPFFTTKPVGVGTGLGLYVSYFIIADNHNGTIKVESEEGQGTKFVIQLPLHYRR
ncbi:MAG: HAMP domain-containing protein [Desulfobacteraceae bacterium]|nr:MAG: HAMP domain-containing protein [Desulfobacteraceae bacterium]